MRSTSILILSFLVLITLSCKKSGNGGESAKKETIKLLSKIKEIGPTQTESTAGVTNFTYDDQGRLILEKGTVQESHYVYKNDQLVEILQVYQSHQISSEISYEGNKISKINSTAIFKNQPNRTSSVSCFYEGDKLSRIDRLDNNLVIQYSYQYSGEKLAKVTMKNANQETVGVNEYTIDDNKNNFQNVNFSAYQAFQLLRLEPPIFNNVASLRSSVNNLNNVNTTSYEYTYDSEGYPLTMIRSHLRFAQTVPVITKYIYEYTVLELK